MNMDRLQNSTSIKGIIQSLAPEQVRMMLAEVTGTDPLRVQTRNDDKLIIPANLLVVPEWLTDHKYPAYIQTDAYVSSAEPSDDEARGRKIDTAPFTRDASCAHVDCSISPCSDHQYKAEWVIIQNHLCVGDVVVLLAFAGGKRYYVLDRVAKEGA